MWRVSGARKVAERSARAHMSYEDLRHYQRMSWRWPDIELMAAVDEAIPVWRLSRMAQK